jgi:hypothetical protein
MKEETGLEVEVTALVRVAPIFFARTSTRCQLPCSPSRWAEQTAPMMTSTN